MAKTIFLDNSILTEDKKHTYLSTDVSSGSVIVVQSNSGLATGQILLIGEIGQEEAEIVRTHSAAAVSGNTITLKDGLAFAHSVDTKITIIDWNQFEVTHSTTNATSGIDSTLTYGLALQVDAPESQYKDTANTSGYYFTRLVDTVGSAYSSYSDAIPYA